MEKTFILYYITIFYLFLFCFYFTVMFFCLLLVSFFFCSNLYIIFLVNFTLNSENDGEKEIFISSFVLVLIFCYNLCIIISKVVSFTLYMRKMVKRKQIYVTKLFLYL
jgi:hypothetical protein